MAKLPDNLSALIRLALEDLRKVEADPDFAVEMGAWMKRRDDICEVCLAGAVMAKTIGLTPRLRGDFEPHSLGDELANKLVALDWARTGRIYNALKSLGVAAEWPLEVKLAPDYDLEPLAFHAYMSDLADRLEAKGL